MREQPTLKTTTFQSRQSQKRDFSFWCFSRGDAILFFARQNDSSVWFRGSGWRQYSQGKRNAVLKEARCLKMPEPWACISHSSVFFFLSAGQRSFLLFVWKSSAKRFPSPQASPPVKAAEPYVFAGYRAHIVKIVSGIIKQEASSPNSWVMWILALSIFIPCRPERKGRFKSHNKKRDFSLLGIDSGI